MGKWSWPGSEAESELESSGIEARAITLKVLK